MLEDGAVLHEVGRDLAVAAAGDGHELAVAQQLADPVGRGAQELGDLRGRERVHRVRAYGARGQHTHSARPSGWAARLARQRPGRAATPEDAGRDRPYTSTWPRSEEQARERAAGRPSSTTTPAAPRPRRRCARPRRPGGRGGCGRGCSRGASAVRLGTVAARHRRPRRRSASHPGPTRRMAHPDGELGTARGAAAAGALMTVSTSRRRTPLEDVAAAETGRRPDVVPALPAALPRAHRRPRPPRRARPATGALVLTVDLPRARPPAAGPAPTTSPCRRTCRMANHPADGDRHRCGDLATPTWTFDDIGRFGELSGLPVVVKGVLRGDDAVALRAGRRRRGLGVHARRPAGRSGGRQRARPPGGRRGRRPTRSRSTSTAASGPARTCSPRSPSAPGRCSSAGPRSGAWPPAAPPGWPGVLDRARRGTGAHDGAVRPAPTSGRCRATRVDPRAITCPGP